MFNLTPIQCSAGTVFNRRSFENSSILGRPLATAGLLQSSVFLRPPLAAHQCSAGAACDGARLKALDLGPECHCKMQKDLSSMVVLHELV